MTGLHFGQVTMSQLGVNPCGDFTVTGSEDIQRFWPLLQHNPRNNPSDSTATLEIAVRDGDTLVIDAGAEEPYGGRWNPIPPDQAVDVYTQIAELSHAAEPESDASANTKHLLMKTAAIRLMDALSVVHPNALIEMIRGMAEKLKPAAV